MPVPRTSLGDHLVARFCLLTSSPCGRPGADTKVDVIVGIPCRIVKTSVMPPLFGQRRVLELDESGLRLLCR